MSEQTKTDTVKKWYVVRAISGQEKKVKQYIEVEINRLGLSNFVSQILIPTEKIYQIRNGKKVSKERPFYGGYILVEAALVGEVAHVIKQITGVIGFLVCILKSYSICLSFWCGAELWVQKPARCIMSG